MDDFKPQQPQKQDDLSSEKPNDFQATYEEKPETYVTPSGEPTTLETVQQTTPLAMPKKKHSAGKWLLSGLVVLLLAGLGAVAYWQWAEAENAKKQLNDTQSQLETTQATLAKADTDKKDDPVTKSPTDRELITQVVTAHIRAEVASKDAEPVVNVMKAGPEFAYVSAGLPGGGGARFILKKVDSVWVVVESGNDTLAADVIKKYGIPTEYQTGQ